MTVNLLCNRIVATVNAGQSITDAAALMREEHVGVIAVDDVIRHLAEQLGRLADLIRRERDVELEARP